MESTDTFQTNVFLSRTIKHDNCDIPSPSKHCLRAISCSALTKKSCKMLDTEKLHWSDFRMKVEPLEILNSGISVHPSH